MTGERGPTACALTGHRDLPAAFDREALRYELQQLIRAGVNTFFCGMARGFDYEALVSLVSLKERYPIRIVACPAYRGMVWRHPLSIRDRYLALQAACDEEDVRFEAYTYGCYHARDRLIVDRADMLFAYCLRNTGGTAYTVRYAMEQNKVLKFFGALSDVPEEFRLNC